MNTPFAETLVLRRLVLALAFCLPLSLRAAPNITTQPGNAVATVGDPAGFLVVAGANGGGTPYYQWTKNGSSIAGATNNTFTISAVADGDAAPYTVVVTNTGGSVTSHVALLTVVDPDIIASQPLNLPVNTCTNITLTVVTHGTDTNLSYQWSFGDAMTPVGDSSSNLVISGVEFANAGLYTVEVSTEGGSSYDYASGALSVTNPPPVVGTGNSITVALNNGSYTLSPSDVAGLAANSDDHCGSSVIASTNILPSSTFGCGNVGTNIVTVQLTDVSNNMATASATVIVQDLTPPSLVLHPLVVTLNANGTYSLTSSDLAALLAGSSDNNCPILSTNLSQSSFTFCDAGSDTVSVTLRDIHGVSTNAEVVVTVQKSANPPAAVYVDASYTNTCGPVSFPDSGGSGTYYIGYNAFNTVQGGVSAVASGGTVNVAAGTYTEEVTIGQPMSLLGPNATNNPNTGPRVPEAIIQPDTSDPNPNDNNDVVMVYVSSDQVTIEGFTIDGSNPALTGATNAVLVGTNEVNVAEGIASYEGVGDIDLENNIVKNTAYSGVDFYNYYDDAATTTNFIRCNLFENIGYAPYDYGFSVLIYNNFYAEISYNVMNQVRLGVQTGNFSQPNPGDPKFQTIHDNTINAGRTGIFHNLAYSGASALTLSNNTITAWAEPGSDTNNGEWDGIVLSSIQSSVTALAVSNTISSSPSITNISGLSVGYNVWNTPTTAIVMITGGSVSNVNYGIWVNDYDGYASPGASTAAIVNGVNLSAASAAGVYVQDDPRASRNGVLVRATVNGNTVITNSALGVWVQGTNAAATVLNNSASINGNGIGIAVDTGKALIENNDLTGNSIAGISVTNSATVDAGDCSGSDVTGLATGSGARGSSAGGNNLSGYAFDNAVPFAIENFNSSSTPAVLAEHNNFGAALGEAIGPDLYDPVQGIVYSQNPLLAAAPPSTNVECFCQAPAPAATLADFLAQGGTVTANAVSVTSMDSPALAPETTTIRTYTLSNGCTSTTCQQTIVVHETNAPVISACPASFVSPGSVVTYTLPTATDDCDPCGNAVTVTGNPPSGSTLPPGVATIVCTAVNLAGLSNWCSFQVVVPNTTLTDAYVDAAYAGLPPGTTVTWPYSGGSGSRSVGFDAFATVQAGVNAVEAAGTVHVAAGNYSESVSANKPVTLQGANLGIPGCGARGPESVINAGAGNAITIGATNVVVDGFELNGAVSVYNAGYAGSIVQNNTMNAAAAGVELIGITTTADSGCTLQNNCITLGAQLVGSMPTVGVGINTVTGTQAPLILSNNVSGAFYGYLLYGLNAAAPTVVQYSSITGVMQGVSVLNVNPLTGTDFSSSTFGVNGVSVSGFTGSYPALESAGNDFHAGVYVFTGGPLTSATLTGVVTNVTVTGSGSISPDSSALYFTDFSTGAGVRQNMTVQNCNISTNENRGIFVSGTNAVAAVSESSVLGNGFNPYGTNGNFGFGIIARNNAQVTVSNCFIANPATVTAPYTVRAVEADANTAPLGPTLVVTDCSIVNNGNSSGYLASQDAGTLNASGNWWGTTNDSDIANLIIGTVDFNPYLDSGVDTDPVTPGFQGDFSTLHVTTLGAQTGGVGRIQEGINDVVGGKVIIEAGNYAENILANKPNLELAGVGQSGVTIVPALSAPNPCPGGDSICSGASIVILVQASGVTIHDLTVDGHNPLLTSGVTGGSVDLDARDGIIEDYTLRQPFNNTVVYNTTVQNIYLRGIYAGSGGTGFFFHDNIVQNVQADPESVAMFNFGGSGIMSNNVVSAANDALSANWSAGTSFLNNTVTNCGSAVHTDNSSGPDLEAGNNASAMQPGAYGFWVFAPYGNVVISNNTVSGCAVGLASAGQSAATTPQFVNNQVTAGAGTGSVGVYETTSLFGYGYSDVSSVFQGNTIQGNAYGFYLEDESGNNLSAAITANNIVTGNQYGIYSTGSPESVKIENADLRNNSSAAIYASGGAIMDAGDCGPDVTGLGASAGGNNLTGYLAGPALAIVNTNSSGSPAVYAYNDTFGATALQPEIASAFSGSVLASQAGGILALAPAPVAVQCPGDVPSAANTLAAFQALGGIASATVASVSSVDSTLNPGPYDGTIIRTYTLLDACGQSTMVNQTITVQDTTPPVITQCAPDETIDADITAHASLPDLTGSAMAADNCSDPVTISQSPTPGTTIGLGTTVVTLKATDASGNVSQPCTANVTVIYTNAPVLACAPDVTVSVSQDREPYATGYPAVTDPDGPITITYSDNASGLTNCDVTGTLLRTWTATDASSNVNTCVQTITVVDTNAPYFTYLPADIATNNDLGQCGAVVSYTAAARDLGYFQGFENTNWVFNTNSANGDLDWNAYYSFGDSYSTMYRAASGSNGIVSPNNVAYAIIDSTITAPNYDSNGVYTAFGGGAMPFDSGYKVALDVYIDFSNPQVINATPTNGYGFDLDTASETLDGFAGGNGPDFVFHVAAYSATGIVVAADNGSADTGSQRPTNLLNTNDYPDHAIITNTGWYTFEWVFRNTNGVLAADLKVRDANRDQLFTQTLSTSTPQTAPDFEYYSVTNVAGNPFYLWFNFIDADKLPIANAIYERTIPVISSPSSETQFPVGTTTVTNTATDACGNSSTNTTFTVTVTDVEPPSANCPGDITVTNDPGQCGAAVNFTIPTNTDNCGVESVVATPASGSAFPVGTTSVTVVVTDIHGNTNFCTFNVTVNDTEPPSANVPAAIIQANDPGQCGALVNFTLPAQTDNCGVAGTSATPPSGSFFPVGTNLVTVVVSDIHGNTATNTFNVIVEDTEPPAITCPANIVQGVDPGQAYATVNFTPIATDNCEIASVDASPASGSQFPIGTNVVTVLATDIHGNSQMCSFTVQVVGLPQITQQPMSRTNNAGTTATFSVVATSPTPLSYLWKKNGTALSDGGNISGSTNSTLTITTVSNSDATSYSVCVSNLAGAVLSSNATLTVIDPPGIVSQPVSITNNATTTATFTVGVSGTAPFGYQWYKDATNQLVDGGNISGSLSNILTLTNVLGADSGLYSVVVTNAAGMAASSNATLVVIDPVIFVQPADVTSPLGGTISFSVTAAGTAPLSYQWQQDDIDLPGATNSTLSIADIVDSDSGDYTVTVSNSVGAVISDAAVLTITHPPVVTSGPDSLIVNQGNTATFTVSVNGATPFAYQWQKNSVNIPDATDKTLVLLDVTPADQASYRVFITNSDGSTFSPTATLTVIVPPAITTQPLSQTNNAGTTATFSAAATGTSPSYYWFKNLTNLLTDGGNISGSSSNILTITNVLGADGAVYSMIASNQAGIAESSNATLVVIDPIITNEPVSVTANLGAPASFTVGAYGTSPQYQWQKDGVNIPDANSATYSIASVADSDRGGYVAIVSNAFGAVTSAPAATLTVIDPPTITNQPASLTVNQGQTASFSVGVSGTAPFAYQWFKSSNSLAGQTNATLTLVNVSAADQANYSVIVTNPAGSAASVLAQLTVIIPPAITNQPQSLTNNATTTASFTVGASGTSPVYQWFRNGTNLLTDLGNISGSATTNLTLTNVLAAADGTYTVVVSNAAGSVTSQPATLVVIDPVIFVQPVGVTNITGSTVSFNVGAVGTQPLYYQWFQNHSPLFGDTSSNLTLTGIADSDAGTYTVVVTNSVGSITSAPAMLVTVPPLIVTQPTNLVVNLGQPASFSVNVDGQTPFTYQWQMNLANILNATNRILTIASTVATNTGSYRVIVTNPNGTEISQSATLLVVIPPAITNQPTNIVSYVGQNVSFTVGASGTAPFAYQWYFNSNSLLSATNITLALNNITTNNMGPYFVVVTNQAGAATSSVATLSVYPTGAATLTLVSYDNGIVTIALTGVPGFPYAIEGSSNLIGPNWVPLQTNEAPYSFIDTNGGAFNTRFYRAVLSP